MEQMGREQVEGRWRDPEKYNSLPDVAPRTKTPWLRPATEHARRLRWRRREANRKRRPSLAKKAAAPVTAVYSLAADKYNRVKGMQVCRAGTYRFSEITWESIYLRKKIWTSPLSLSYSLKGEGYYGVMIARL